MNIGILGFAHGHVNNYARQWREHPEMDIRITAGWDHDPERTAKAEKNLSIEMAPTPEALLQDPKVQGVVIATETSLHAELVEKAAKAGKTIVLQKPIALTMDEADRICRAVEDTGVRFTLAWQMRVDRQNLTMRELLQGGDLGNLYMIRRRHGLATQTFPDFETSWHVNPKLNRDIWADDAAHPIDFIYWLLGMPGSVTAELASLRDPRVPNDNGIAVFRYPSGVLAEITCSFVCLAHEPTTEIVAEKGVVIQNYGDGPSSNGPRPSEGIELKRFRESTGQWENLDVPGYGSQGDRIAYLAHPLSEFFHGKRPPIATADDGRDVLRLVLACYESSDQGKRIVLDGAQDT